MPADVRPTAEEPIEVFREHVQGPVASLRLRRSRHRLRRLHDTVGVHSRLGVERSPDDRRRVEENGLRQQDERHPLVVGNHAPMTRPRTTCHTRKIHRVPKYPVCSEALCLLQFLKIH